MPCLVVMNGAAEGRMFALRAAEPVSIGRDDQCTFQIVDPAISRKHLQITHDAPSDRCIARDYRSANGVFINDEQITIETVLNDGDRIRIGDTTLVFLDKDYPDAPSAMKVAKGRKEWERGTLLRKTRDDTKS